MRLASIRRSRYWMNVTDIGEALHDLRPAVIDLVDLLEEMQQQTPEAVPCDPGREPDVAPLVEVPVMLSLVAMANRNRRLFPA